MSIYVYKYDYYICIYYVSVKWNIVYPNLTTIQGNEKG